MPSSVAAVAGVVAAGAQAFAPLPRPYHLTHLSFEDLFAKVTPRVVLTLRFTP
jgi:hypothetical protein